MPPERTEKPLIDIFSDRISNDLEQLQRLCESSGAYFNEKLSQKLIIWLEHVFLLEAGSVKVPEVFEKEDDRHIRITWKSEHNSDDVSVFFSESSLHGFYINVGEQHYEGAVTENGLWRVVRLFGNKDVFIKGR